MDNSRVMGYSSRPLNYEELILEQIQRIAQDVRGEEAIEKTLANIEILDIETTIDHDELYDKEIQELIKREDLEVQNTAYDTQKKRHNSDIAIRVHQRYAKKKLRAIMRCLKRANRFPAKYGIDYDEEGKELQDTPITQSQ
jgi:hypothetical protein